MNIHISSFHCLILAAALVIFASWYLSNYSFGLTDQNFTSPRFGISMQFPSDWTFVENVYEDRDYRPNDPSAYVGTFCPTASLDSSLGNPSCNGLDVRVYVNLFAFKLNPNTTLKEFYDEQANKLEATKKSVGRKNLETNEIQVSGLPAMQVVSIVGGGSLDKILDSMGQETTKSKVMHVYLLNGETGYRIWADIDDEQNYDMYLPTIQRIINSIKIQGTN